MCVCVCVCVCACARARARVCRSVCQCVCVCVWDGGLMGVGIEDQCVCVGGGLWRGCRLLQKARPKQFV